jgi:hypothetical protein
MRRGVDGLKGRQNVLGTPTFPLLDALHSFFSHASKMLISMVILLLSARRDAKRCIGYVLPALAFSFLFLHVGLPYPTSSFLLYSMSFAISDPFTTFSRVTSLL